MARTIYVGAFFTPICKALKIFNGFLLMLKVLIIKISSMGDIIHTLPALSDAKKAYSDISFDWVVAPQFSEIPLWHSAVNKLILCPIRKWKHNLLQAFREGEIQHFIQLLRQQNYDLIIDAQSALKTAVISKIAHGKSAGFDKKSVREYGAHWLYKRRFFVEKNQHAITRTRKLFSEALGYSLEKESPNDFGINLDKLPEVSVTLPHKYVMAIPNTTWPAKHWPEQHWQNLIQTITATDLHVVIPWGNEAEKRRAESLSAGNNQAHILPKLSLGECARVIKNAAAAICVDTGLGHLTSALQIPALHLYGPTDPLKIGAFEKNQTQLPREFQCAPQCKRVCRYNAVVSQEAQCLAHLTPQKVWQTLRQIIDR